MLDPRRLLRWIYIGRLIIAVAIFLAAILLWTRAEQLDQLIVSLAFALATAVTVASWAYSEINKRPLRTNFLYLQSAFDLLLITVVVHVTGGATSQFAALYILVIAVSTLLLPIGGGLLIAALGNVLYVAEVIFFAADAPLTVTVWLQLGVFTAVALGSAYLAVQLRREGEGKASLVAALQQEKLRADDILRNIRSGVLTVDVEGRLLYANPTAEQMLGLDLSAQFGQKVVNTIARVSPDLAHAIERSITERVRTTRAEAMVTTNSRKFPIGVATTYMEGDGRTNRTTTAIFQDISDVKRMDALRMRAERLEGVAELSAALAHEIKNPLASIRSAIEQLSRVEHVTEDERTLSTLVMRESDRLSRLLSEFLDFARVRVARAEQVNVGDILRGAATLAQSHPDRREGVRVTCSVPERALVIEGDEDLLHRAIFNLALNAVQASPADGEVRIEAGIVDPDRMPLAAGFEPGSVAVRVSDEGPGIPPESRDRLFDPFFTTKPGGNGLGLAVVHRAIEAHRGLVFFDTAGRMGGTRFTVIIPRTRSGAAPHTVSAI